MKIVISSGHGKYIRGASDILDEVDEARKVVERVADFLRSAGVGVTTYHDDVSNDQSENLNRIVDYHNSQTRDLDVSVHFNAYEHTSKPMGTECLWVTQRELAADVAAEIAIASGLIDRGPKERTDLFFLNNTEEPAILIETCFCDSQADADIYRQHFDDIARAIAETVSSETIPPIGEQPPERPPPGRPQWPDRPEGIPVEDRPTLRQGDEGHDVLDMQRMIPRFTGAFDGDFGPTTYENVVRYQRSRGLDADGICGQQTWGALYDHALPVPPPPPPPGALTAEQQAAIMKMAVESEIAGYSW